ncbi:MAG TPA: glycosyl hydrolase [Polyangiaceae bacterium]
MKFSFAITIAGLAALVVGAGACGSHGAVDDATLEARAGAAGAAGALTNSSGTGNVSGAMSSAGGASGGAATAGAGQANAGGSTAGAPAAGAPSAGGGSDTAAGGSPGAAGAEAVKGLAFNLSGSSCDDLKTLGVSWFYAWSATNPCPTATMEFVPQVWGSWTKLSWVPTPAKAVAKGAKALLGFNEPDGSDQANLTVDEAIALWPDTDQPGVLIGSPAVAGMDTWLPNFMTQVAAKNLRVDFIAVHWYGWDSGSCNDTSALEGKIKWAEQWKKPIWITEWSCRLQSVDVDKKFLSDALVMLKKHPLVVRYAWFLSRSTGDFVNAALLDGGGKATGIGSEYVAAPATQ